MHRGTIAALLVAGSVLAGCSTTQVVAQTGRPVSEPYGGSTMIFERPDRDARLQINRVMDLLKIGPGKTVADIGAGGGWFTVRAARRVGLAGKVYAVEINRNYVEEIDRRAKRENLDNVVAVLGTSGDPKLPTAGIDAALMLKMYHEVAEPIALLKQTRTALRPDGLLGIIDRNGRGNDHGIAQEVVVREAAQAGFELVQSYDFVKGDGEDYLLVFKRTAR